MEAMASGRAGERRTTHGGTMIALGRIYPHQRPLPDLSKALPELSKDPVERRAAA